MLKHAVEGMNGEVHLGRPAPVCVRARLVTDYLLEPADSRLGPGSPSLAGGFLPGCAPVLGDAVQVAISLHRCGRGCLARPGSTPPCPALAALDHPEILRRAELLGLLAHLHVR